MATGRQDCRPAAQLEPIRGPRRGRPAHRGGRGARHADFPGTRGALCPAPCPGLRASWSPRSSAAASHAEELARHPGRATPAWTRPDGLDPRPCRGAARHPGLPRLCSARGSPVRSGTTGGTCWPRAGRAVPDRLARQGRTTLLSCCSPRGRPGSPRASSTGHAALSRAPPWRSSHLGLTAGQTPYSFRRRWPIRPDSCTACGSPSPWRPADRAEPPGSPPGAERPARTRRAPSSRPPPRSDLRCSRRWRTRCRARPACGSSWPPGAAVPRAWPNVPPGCWAPRSAVPSAPPRPVWRALLPAQDPAVKAWGTGRARPARRAAAHIDDGGHLLPPGAKGIELPESHRLRRLPAAARPDRRRASPTTAGIAPETLPPSTTTDSCGLPADPGHHQPGRGEDARPGDRTAAATGIRPSPTSPWRQCRTPASANGSAPLSGCTEQTLDFGGLQEFLERSGVSKHYWPERLELLWRSRATPLASEEFVLRERAAGSHPQTGAGDPLPGATT